MQRSPSAAFGRLRIDSPAAHSRAQRSAQRLLDEKTVAATERSPLLIRQLESLPSDISFKQQVAPPFYIWIGPALICALCYALYNIFIKKGSATIHPVLGGVILQLVAALLGAILLTVLIGKDGMDELNYDRDGVQWAICAGIAVGSAEILSFIVSGMGVQAMQSIPIIIGGSVLFGTVLGFTVQKEMLTYRGWLGVIMIAAGIALVGTDPGGAGGVH